MLIGARTAVWNGKSLPYKRQLAYLESHGTEWIDTGVYGEVAVEAQFSATTTAVISDQGYIYGREINKSPYHCCGVRMTSSLGQFNITYDRLGSYYENKFGTLDTAVHTTKEWNFDEYRFCYFDSRSGTLATDTSQVAPYSITLFCENNNGTKNRFSKTRIYYIKMFSDIGMENISHHFVPVMSLDDEPCMYDEISGQLFKNQGTGVFGYGELD